MNGDQYNPHFSGGGWGGGFGGWGGGWGGIAPVGLFGLIGANGFGRGFGHDGGHGGHRCCKNDCCEEQLEMINDTMNARFNTLEGRDNTLQIENQIHSVDNRLSTFKDFTLTAFGDLKRENALLGKDIVIANKDIDNKICGVNRNIDDKFCALQHNLDKCCCAIIKNDDCNTQKVLDRLCQDEKARLRDEIAELRAFRNGINLRDSVITSVRATTIGSNFNTGTQTQSNNSGQIVG